MSTYSSFVGQVTQHNNKTYVVRPDHVPKVGDALRDGTLGCDVSLLLVRNGLKGRIAGYFNVVCIDVKLFARRAKFVFLQL